MSQIRALTSRYAPPEGWSQKNQRTSTDFTDQHGRQYHAVIEIKTGDPVGMIEPLFTAPLMPEQKYLRRVPRRPYDINIDYESWKRDIRGAWGEWQREGRSLAKKLHGSAYDPKADFTSDVLEVIGPAPQPIEPVIAASQGNKWVLGLTSKVDLRLARFFEPEQLDPDYSNPREPNFSDDDDEEAPTRGPQRPSTEPKTERNAEIVADLEDGRSVKWVAEKHGISEGRVREINRRHAHAISEAAGR